MMHFRAGAIEEAQQLVKRHHYSRRIPANVQFVGTWHKNGGLFGDYGEAVAACFFSIPPTRWTVEVWELSRLVRNEECTRPLTGLISASLQHASKMSACPGIFVSFADRTYNHHGGIYQAASWNFHGKRQATMDGLMINGQFVPGRSCNSAFGTRSPQKLQSLRPDDIIEPHMDAGKYLYWKATNKKGMASARALQFLCRPYPKPNMAGIAA